MNANCTDWLAVFFQSFANISRATTDQLTDLPGFGPKKIARMKEAFDKPFRNSATSALDFPSTSSQPKAQSRLPPSATDRSGANSSITAGSHDKGKGKEKEPNSGSSQPPPRPPVVTPLSLASKNGSQGSSGARPREPSPVWDIELDLNSPSPSPPLPLRVSTPIQGPIQAQGKKRAASPVWDIELDLNGSDIEMDEDDGREKKRKKG